MQQRPKVRWLAIIMGGVCGAVLTLGLIPLLARLLVGGWVTTWESFLGVVMAVFAFSCFFGGLVAGLWARSAGGTHGAWAGICLVAIYLVTNLAMGYGTDIMGLLLDLIIAIPLGALGGLVGARIRQTRA